jgi:hypothetical protein
MYYISSNAGRSGSRFSFVIYQSTACILLERTQNVLYTIQRRSERLDVLFLLLYINQPHITGVECTQNVLYIIQRRSTRRAFSFVIYHSTAYSGVKCTQILYPTCIKYHPTPIGATLYQWIVPKMYYISSNADRQHRSERLTLFVWCGVECTQNLC